MYNTNTATKKKRNPKKVKFETTNELTIKGIIGFIKRKVTPHVTGAKVTCPKEHIGKTALLIITNEELTEANK